MTVRRAHRPFQPTAAARPALLAPVALALGLLAGSVSAPSPARAQFFGGWGGWDNGGTWDGMEPQQVRRAISQRGFRVLAPLRRNGNVFVADVLDQRGQHERLIVAAADAQILQRFMVDDGRQPGAFPRGTDDGRDFTARGGDDDRGLVPPGDIPNARRIGRPIDRDAAPPQRYGDLGTGDDGSAEPESPLHRAPPPIRTVKPRPRVVERTPEPATGGREPGPVESTPLAPVAPRPAPPAPVAKAPAAAPAPVVASRPEPAAAPAPAPAAQAAPAAPAPATASRRMTDPLAIPAGDDAKPVRNVAAGITGSPAPAAAPAKPAAAPAKPADVPVAPLD
ncbi:hypothetical protein [Lichenibacterium dinghuense]|uniref:hypothetical protein n=1 Tax=Lichenibacterium dinghuense TaxID=2895977 RepID=UPI001F284BD6|nr:hypothetical protein [Lichenibacterium sp. 6Y81]